MKRKIALLVLFTLVPLLATAVFFWPLAPKPAKGAAATVLPVLVYHAIHLDPSTPNTTTKISYRRFAEQMRYLYYEGYTTLGMEEVEDFLKGKPLPPKVVAITFDDGLTSSLYAVPLLYHYGFKSTFFIITSLAEPHPERPGADNLYMSWRTLSLLGKVPGVEFQSHTITHPWEKGKRLTDWTSGAAVDKTTEDARFELTESKKQLEERLGHPVRALAWPTGVYDEVLIAMAKDAGYKALFTTKDRFNNPESSPFHIHRIIIDGACDLEIFKKTMKDGQYRSC